MERLADILDDGDARQSATDKPITIYIVRHGATKLNNDVDTSVDRIRGWKDIPLVEKGREEARQAGVKLKGKGIGAIVCSDLSRAHETADIIGKIIGVKPEPAQKLRPWNLGTLQGTTTKEALPQIARYAQETPDKPVPEGESFDSFKARAFRGFYEAVAKDPGKPVLIVTHHRNERLIEAWDKAGQPADHEIDLKTFLQKGDPPGGVKVIHTSEAALRGNGPQFSGTEPTGGGMQEMPSPRQQFLDKYSQGARPAPGGDMRDVMAHGRAIAGAKALHAVGHITARQRDQHVAKSQKAIGAARKPFGAFAP